MTTPRPFNERISSWKAEQQTPWGGLRYRVSQANLARHLPQQPLHILDVGGGNGVQSIYYALQGHRVALVDFSTEMLAEARREAEANAVVDRIIFHEADVGDIPGLFPEPTFDLVLCHNVIQYVDDLPTFLRAITSPLRHDGLLSLMSVNGYSETYRLALQRLDPAAAEAQLDATTRTAILFDTPVRYYAAQEVVEPLSAVGCAVVGQYGVRCVCDYMPDNEIKYDPAFFEQLERLELAMADRYPYHLLARYFQLVAQKTIGKD